MFLTKPKKTKLVFRQDFNGIVIGEPMRNFKIYGECDQDRIRTIPKEKTATVVESIQALSQDIWVVTTENTTYIVKKD